MNITVEGLSEVEGSLHLLTSVGTEVVVPTCLWKGDIQKMSEHLPFILDVVTKDGKVVKVNGLPGYEECMFFLPAISFSLVKL